MKSKISFTANRMALATSFLLLFITSSLVAQVPQGIPYQAMIRGNDGAALVNANVTVRFTLHQNTTTGPVEYQETQALTTNAYGLINTQFGIGTPTQGTFAGIVWSNTSKFIQVEANDGNGYLDMGTQQMMSVPYAMYAGSAGQSIVPLGTQTGDMLYWDSGTETWIALPSGNNGQALYNCDGVPTWGGCAPIVGNLTVSGITPYTAYAEFPMSSNGGNAPTSIGFYLSTSSNVSPSNGQFLGGTWPGGGISNWINSNNAAVPGGSGTIKSGNDGATSISSLSPNTQYYIIGAVSNAKGTTVTAVMSFNTPVLVEGCMESGACNYNPSANYNGGCFYAAYGYLCDGGCAGDADQDGVCDAFDACSDVNACNYNNSGNPGCAYDADADGLCDDQDGCLDNNACNWQANSPFTPCQYAENGYLCDGSCAIDVDGDNICDVVDTFICSNDIDSDQVCDDIDQCTDVNACNYNQHWLDVGYGEFYTCRYDIDGDGFCSLNSNYGYNDNYNLYDQNENISYSNENGQFVSIPISSFDFCENLTACNVIGNGFVFGTILNFNDGSMTRDLGTLMSWHYNSNFGSYSSISGYDYLPAVGFLGCVFDTDLDGICDTQDHCRDLNACNYNDPENEWCFPDLDSDGICDNLDGCFYTDYCTYSNPNATSCQNTGGPCNSTDPNATYAMYDANCVCQQYYAGCTEPNACNFTPNAWPDDGSCLYINASCDDGNPSTVNDIINSICICNGSSNTGSGTGAQLLPGNTICESENISVTGCNGQTSITYFDRSYNLVEIFGQCWFAENLATDKYQNGDAILTGVPDGYEWETLQIGAYSIYNNNYENDIVYGKLYNAFAAIDERNICPSGWHVPTDCDWMYLENNLGMSLFNQQSTEYYRGSIEGGNLKSLALWNSPNEGADNSTSFSALPGGFRNWNGGGYFSQGDFGAWWSSTQTIDNSVYWRYLSTWNAIVGRNNATPSFGASIRCIKD